MTQFIKMAFPIVTLGIVITPAPAANIVLGQTTTIVASGGTAPTPGPVTETSS